MGGGEESEGWRRGKENQGKEERKKQELFKPRVVLACEGSFSGELCLSMNDCEQCYTVHSYC